MHPLRKRRLILISVGLVALFGASALALTALNQNLQHFYSPSDILAGSAPEERRFRLGGLVEEGSVSRDPESLTVHFLVTDEFQTFPVTFNGILPDLFREGQSVVATGRLDAGVFHAEEVLAKHDENYMPKEVADAIARAKEAKGREPPASAGAY
jgi:cytochrome c-type biogenesis protein CcmE